MAEETAVGDIARGRTPRRAVSLSVILALVSVGLNWWLPEAILGILINAIGMVLLIAWVFIIISQIRLRPLLRENHDLPIRMPGWPWTGYLALAGLAVMGVLMALSPSARPQLISMLGLMLIIMGIYWIREKLARR